MGHGSAYRLEWLLNGAKWDADVLRDRVRDYVVASLGAEDGVLVADDTQVIKKGVKSVGWPASTAGRPGRPRTVRKGSSEKELPNQSHLAGDLLTARRVREAVRGNGPVERPTPRLGPTSQHSSPAPVAALSAKIT